MSLAGAKAQGSPIRVGADAASPVLPAAVRPLAALQMAPDALTPSLLHELYLQPLFRFVSHQVQDTADAEDVTAEVFAALFQALPRFRGDCDPYLWLLSIARRKIADHLRRRARRRETNVSALLQAGGEEGFEESRLWPSVPGPDAVRLEAAREIRRIVDSLKEEQRTALLLKYVEGLSITEIAVVMRKSPAAVNSLLQRARETALRRGRPYFLGDGPGANSPGATGKSGSGGSEPGSDPS